MITQSSVYSLPPFKQGQSVILKVRWVGPDGLIGLSGAWIGCTFRLGYDQDAIFTVSTDTGDIVVAEDGQIVITICEDKTALLGGDGLGSKGVFDVKVVFSPCNVDFPISDGRWRCLPASTTDSPA